MNNEKLENLLNLALNATPEEREKSLELNIGYDTTSRSWEVIVKASGGFDMLPELFPQITIHPLLNGYGILTVPADLLDALSERPEIEYMEKPKRLFFAVNSGRSASCITPLQTAPNTISPSQPIPDVKYSFFHFVRYCKVPKYSANKSRTKQSLWFRYHHCHHRLRH